MEPTALNGSSAVRFAGAGQFLVGAAALAFAAFDGFVVWQTSVAASSATETHLLDGGESFRILHGAPDAATRHALQSSIGGALRTLQFAPAQANRGELWNFTFDQQQPTLSTRSEGGGAISLENLGAALDTATTALALAANAAGNFPFSGDIAELIIYDRVLADEERSSVVAYLTQKWSLQLRQCDAGEVLGPNGDCYYYDTTPRSWSNARNSCQNRGGGWDLTSIRSALENTFATTLLPNETWLGGVDPQSAPESFSWADDGTVFWNGEADGSPPAGSYANFGATEPNGGGDGDDCLRILPSGLWADLDCPSSLPYLCQGPAN